MNKKVLLLTTLFFAVNCVAMNKLCKKAIESLNKTNRNSFLLEVSCLKKLSEDDLKGFKKNLSKFLIEDWKGERKFFEGILNNLEPITNEKIGIEEVRVEEKEIGDFVDFFLHAISLDHFAPSGFAYSSDYHKRNPIIYSLYHEFLNKFVSSKSEFKDIEV